MPDRSTPKSRSHRTVSGHRHLALLAVLLLLAPVAMAAGPARLMVLQNDALGKYLVDDLGRGLYVFVDPAHEDDLGTAENRPTRACDATCRAVWPPFLTHGDPVAVPRIAGDLLATVTTDAGNQVTFNGWPLYRFAADRTRGDAQGEGIEPPSARAFGGAWYLIGPDGSLVEPEDDGAHTPKSGGGNAGVGDRRGYY